MSHSTLIVQLELGRLNAAPLGVARDLAKRTEASVIGIAAAQPIQMVVGDGFYPGEIIRQDAEWIERQGKAAEEEFRKEMDGVAKSLEWDMSITDYSLSGCIAAATGPGDMLVVGAPREAGDSPGSMRRVDLDDLIMEAGRPVLVVPPGVRRFDFGCALVAWKTSREARRAVTDALPLLRMMKKVVIVEVVETASQGTAQASLGKMVAWLARQGVAALPRLAIAAGDDGDRLLALAGEEGAELVVAGAYGHTRFREWVLGGVTRNLIRHSSQCLLLSH